MSQFSENDFYYSQPGAGPSMNYKWTDNPMEGISYEMDAEFGQEQQFQSFDYSQTTAPASDLNSAQMYPNLQGFNEPNYFVPTTSYTGQLLDPTTATYTGPSTSGGEFEDEPPLLEELGINPDHIVQKTLAVLNPFRETDASILQDTDLAGPLVFCLAFGAFLLLSGKVHFSYIYGIGVLGCLAMYALLNLMAVSGVSIGVTVSVLGYCLLPMVALSGLSILVSLQGLIGIGLTAMAILWCSLSSSKLFVTALTMDRQQPLVAYPCALLYGVFALLTIF